MHDLSRGYNGFSANQVADVATACSMLGLEGFPAWITEQSHTSRAADCFCGFSYSWNLTQFGHGLSLGLVKTS